MSRIAQIAASLRVPTAIKISQLGPPKPLPLTQEIHHDHAEEYLDDRRIDSHTAKQSSKISSILKSKKQRHKAPERTLIEVFNALEAIVKQHDFPDSPEVAQVLISQLQSLGGNPNYIPPPKQSLTKRFGSSMKLAPNESQLLQIATKSKQQKMISVLASWSTQPTLDACLGIAIAGDDLAAAELLLRYGADVMTVEEEFPLWKAVRERKMARVRLLLKAPKPPCGECLSQALLQAVHIQDIQAILELTAVGAKYSFENFKAITIAVASLNLEMTVAILVSGGKLPPAQLLDKLISEVFLAEERMGHERWYQLLEVLLCAGATGNNTSECLIQAVMLNSLEIAKLFVSYGASVDHDSAKALQCAVSKPNLDLITLLLSSHSPPSPIHVSAAVHTAMQIDGSATRLQVMKYLHLAGAAGREIDIALVTATNKRPIEQPDIQLIELLLEMGADVNYEDGQAIEIATTRRNLGMLKRLLSAGPSPNTLCRAYNTALNVLPAARQKIISLLFKMGMPINDQVNSSLATLVKSPLVDHELIKLLLENHAMVSFNRGQCLVNAGLASDVQTFQMLIASVPSSSPELIASILLGVFRQTKTQVWDKNGLQIMKLLLKKGVWTNTVDDILVFSIEAAHTQNQKGENKHSKTMEFVSLLLEHGADRNHECGLVLQKAAQYGMLDIVGLLVGENCSLLTLNSAFPYLLSSETAIPEDFVLALIPLFWANRNSFDEKFRHPVLDPAIILALRRYPQSELLLRALLESKFPVDETVLSANEGFALAGEWITPLLWIAGQTWSPRQIAMIKILLEFGANVNFYSAHSGTTPLLLATKAKNHELLEILLKAGADASVADTTDTSLLWYATHMNDSIAIDMLLEAGATQNDGSLHEASLQLNLKNIEKLLDGGHNLEFPCTRYNGRTALEEVCVNSTGTAKYLPSQETLLASTIKLLVSRGADLKRRQNGKSLLLLALDSANPIPSVKVLLRTYMYKYINKTFNHYTKNGFTYSPTMYIKKGLCKSPIESQPALLKLLIGSNGMDVFYNENEMLPQPEDVINAPPNIVAAQMKHLAEDFAEEKRQKHVLRLREEGILAAALAADLANKEFLQNKQNQEQLAKVQEKLDAEAEKRRQKAKKEETEAFQLLEARDMKLQREALENSRRVQVMDAMTARANQKAQQELIDQEIAHRLRIKEMDRERDERLSLLLAAEQKVLENMEKHMTRREKMDKLSERRLADEKKMMEDRQKQWTQQERLSGQQQSKIEGQLQQQREIVRDMERAKEQLNSLRAGGGMRRYSNFSDESQ